MIEGPFQHLRRHFDQRACEERAERSCIATWHTCLEPGQADLIQELSGVGPESGTEVRGFGFRCFKTLLFLSLICCSWHQLAAQILIRWDPALRMKRYSWEWPWAAQWLGEKCWNEDHSFIVCCVLRRNPDPQKQHVPRCSREEGRARCSAREGRSPDFSPPSAPFKTLFKTPPQNAQKHKTHGERGVLRASWSRRFRDSGISFKSATCAQGRGPKHPTDPNRSQPGSGLRVQGSVGQRGQ